MKIKFFVIPMLVTLMLAGCKQKVVEEPEMVPAETIVSEEGDSETEVVELVPVLRKAKPVQQKTAPAKKSGQTAPAAKASKTSETMYVETDGAQGRVWGHVNMNGDRGTGTIHDWDENTWAVTVTRHGDELFAVDQNSRLYVFKLKQNKTQQ